MKLLFAGALTAVLGLSCIDAAAQVNVELLRRRIKAKGVSFILEGTFDGHTGNTYGMTADGLVGGGVSGGRSLAFAFASADYSKLNGSLGVDKSFAHARYNYEIVPWLWWEVYAQIQSNAFQLLAVRNIAGTGPRFALLDDKAFSLFLGAAYMLESDIYDVAPGSLQNRTPIYSRISTYLSARATLADGIDAVTTTYFQPRTLDPGDIRVHSESGFVFKVTKVLSTGVTFTANYDSNPAPTVLRTDTELKNVITLSL